MAVSYGFIPVNMTGGSAPILNCEDSKLVKILCVKLPFIIYIINQVIILASTKLTNFESYFINGKGK